MTSEQSTTHIDMAPPKLIAGCFGLAAFSIALLIGLAGDNPASDVLLRAVVSLFACYLVGYGIGIVGSRAIDEAVVRSRQNQRDQSRNSDAASATAGAQTDASDGSERSQ